MLLFAPEVPPTYMDLALRGLPPYNICRTFLEFHAEGKEKDGQNGRRNAPTSTNKRRSLGVGPTLAYPPDDSHAIRVFVKAEQCKCKKIRPFFRKDPEKVRIMNVFRDKFTRKIN